MADVSKYLKAAGISARAIPANVLRPDAGTPAVAARPVPKWKPANRDKPEAVSTADRQRQALIDTKDHQRRLWQRYLANEARRVSELRARSPVVARYIKALDRIGPDTVAIGWRDVDQDIADLMARIRLAEKLPDKADRFLVYELTLRWVEDIEKRCGTWRIDCPDVFGECDPNSTRETIRKELEIT